jgi:DNA-directed RNA polymerase I, II, and III subunit RPABC2
MEDYQIEEPEVDDLPEEDDLLGEEEDEVDITEQQRADAADLHKLFRQHPEIWIPYSDQIQQQLPTQKPLETEVEEDVNIHGNLLTMNLREIAKIDSQHCTYPFLTNYERTKCISFRASQISNGAKPYILVPSGVTDSYEIAKMELEQKRLPFIIKRPIPDGSFEVWRLSDLVMV